ncbi:MAG: ABC transporter ATP-binding protein, partial [Actinomyces sp.]|nr:ABC transporter ATP-binding protein [Actinomyces sp.]
MSLVCLRDVTRTVTLPDGEDLHILRGVNLDVAEGEHVSIVGRS